MRKLFFILLAMLFFLPVSAAPSESDTGINNDNAGTDVLNPITTPGPTLDGSAGKKHNNDLGKNTGANTNTHTIHHHDIGTSLNNDSGSDTGVGTDNSGGFDVNTGVPGGHDPGTTLNNDSKSDFGVGTDNNGIGSGN